MALALRAQQLDTGNVTTHSLVLPTPAVGARWVLAVVGLANYALVTDPPAGWTLIDTENASTTTAGNRARIYYRDPVSGDAGTTLTLDTSAAARLVILLWEETAADVAVAPIVTAANSSSTAVTSQAAPDLAGTVGGTWNVLSLATAGGDGDVAFALPSGHSASSTEQFIDVGTTDINVAAGWKSYTAATGAQTATIDRVAGGRMTHQLVGIKLTANGQAAVTAEAGANRTAYIGDNVTVTGSVTEGATPTWRQVSGPAVTLAPTGVSVAFTATAAGTVRLGLIATLGGTSSTEDFIDVVVSPAPNLLRPASSVGTGLTAVGAADVALALADDSDATLGQSAANPSGATHYVKLGTATDPQSNTGHSVRVRLRAPGSTTSTIVVDLLEGTEAAVTGGTGATRASRTASNVSPTTFTEFTWALTAGEADSIADYNALWLRFTMTAAV